jgi:hypothetical protein
VLLALSVSPVVGIFVGALGTGLGALLGLSDTHFSTAKGLRIGAMGIALLVGTGGGLYIRTHNLLSPSLREQRDEYIALGYSQADALRLLEGRIVGATTPAAVVGAATADTPAQRPTRVASTAASGFAGVGSNLFSSPAATSDCEELRIPKEREGQVTAHQLIENFRAYPGWRDLADAVPPQAPDADKKALLMIALHAACGADPLRPATPLRPTVAQCEAGDFAGSGSLRPVSARIHEEISPPMRAPAQSLVARFLCSLKP